MTGVQTCALPIYLEVYKNGVTDVGISEKEAGSHIREPLPEKPVVPETTAPEPTAPETAAPTEPVKYEWEGKDKHTLQDREAELVSEGPLHTDEQRAELKAVRQALGEIKGKNEEAFAEKGAADIRAMLQAQADKTRNDATNATADHVKNPTDDTALNAVDKLIDADKAERDLEEHQQTLAEYKAKQGKAASKAKLTNIFNKLDEPTDATALLDVLSKSENPITRLIAIKAKDNLTTKIARSEGKTHYDPATDTVYVAKEHYGSEETLTHEFAHALTNQALHNPTKVQKPYTDSIHAL